MNVYLIETPLQLLNAIEAKNHFNFKNNILVILLNNNFGINSFNKLINDDAWNMVYYIPFYSKYLKYDFGEHRPRNLYELGIEYYITLQQLLKRYRLEKIIKSIGYANNIILGNYLQGHKDYMRHFANTLKHEKTYVIDDGTDTILINKQRANELSVVGNELDINVSGFKKMKRSLRKSYVDWNGNPAHSITYFSCYDISVIAVDRFVKNEYQYLRREAKTAAYTDEVIFLGQCLIEDSYISKDNYLKYILKAKEYFVNEKFIYVPHPRESSQSVEYLKRQIGLEVRKLSRPIEYELAFGGKKPRYLSSFFCSALENCSLIMDNAIIIKAFYIYPQHLLNHSESVKEIYNYFEARSDDNFEVIKDSI